MEQESSFGTDAPWKELPMSRRGAEKRTLWATTGTRNNSSEGREKHFGAKETHHCAGVRGARRGDATEPRHHDESKKVHRE
jgi:hypothetical protein